LRILLANSSGWEYFYDGAMEPSRRRAMCLHPTAVPPVPDETVRVAQAAFPHSHPYLIFRDCLGSIFADAQFASFFPVRGQPATAPWRLALVTLLQFAEHLSDRQAADAVRARLDWKYLLSLELTDPGFDASILCEFRQRLVARAGAQLLFETLLTACRQHRLLKSRSTQRTDSTIVLAAVRRLNRLELAGETLRHALNVLATVAPEWLRGQVEPAWEARYGHRFELTRLPEREAQREALAGTIGADGFRLLTAVWDADAPAALRELPAVERLRQVWVQQYYRDETQLRWRSVEELPPAPVAINSPYDEEARYSQKRHQEWVGYTWHVTEACDPELPRLITDVQTTPAPVPDTEVRPQIQAALARRDLLPDRQLADTGYTEATAWVQSREQYAIELVGPVAPDTSWQAREGTGFAAADFRIDWEHEQAWCPTGKPSRNWHETQKHGQRVVQIDFARQDCQECPHRGLCSRSAERPGRRLTLLAAPEGPALQAARARAETPEYAAAYARRAGVEATHHQAVVRCDVRHCRYVGMAKTRLQHLCTAAALNLLRTSEWLLGHRPAATRQSPFVRLMQAPA
jgi:transposase